MLRKNPYAGLQVYRTASSMSQTFVATSFSPIIYGEDTLTRVGSKLHREPTLHAGVKVVTERMLAVPVIQGIEHLAIPVDL